MIRTTMIGCVGKDAELNEINGNQYVCFDLAHSEKVRGEKRTTWVRVRKLDRDGMFAQWITKGKPVYVEGRPQVTAYTSKDGTLMAEMTIWADRLEFIAGANSAENGTANGQPAVGQHRPQQQPTRTAANQIPRSQAFDRQAPVQDIPEGLDDDLPF